MGRELITDPTKLQAADATGDGAVNIADYDAIFKHVMGRELLN